MNTPRDKKLHIRWHKQLRMWVCHDSNRTACGYGTEPIQAWHQYQFCLSLNLAKMEKDRVLAKSCESSQEPTVQRDSETEQDQKSLELLVG